MTKTNVEIVQDYIDAINHNQFDRIYDFCSKDCVYHVPPWVGVGLRPDLSSGRHVIVHSLIPGGTAADVFKPGDEIIRVSDEQRIWDTFQDLKNAVWGQGIPGTPLTVIVKRDGRTLELHLKRGLIPPFDNRLADYLELWRKDKLENWPDLKTEIKMIFGKDDLVAFYAIDSGTYKEFKRFAVWSECSIYRLQDGKITEMWGAEDMFQQLAQLGYEIREPRLEPAV